MQLIGIKCIACGKKKTIQKECIVHIYLELETAAVID